MTKLNCVLVCVRVYLYTCASQNVGQGRQKVAQMYDYNSDIDTMSVQVSYAQAPAHTHTCAGHARTHRESGLLTQACIQAQTDMAIWHATSHWALRKRERKRARERERERV